MSAIPAIAVNGIPPVERRMLELLSDGQPHGRDALHAQLWDELGDVTNIKTRISQLRKHLRPWGLDVLVQFDKRRVHYRLVRLVLPNVTLLPPEYTSSYVGPAAKV